MKRCFMLFALLCVSTCAFAQKADAAFVVGGSFVSDSKLVFGIPCFVQPCPAAPVSRGIVKTDHHFFLEGDLGLRLLDGKAAALYLDVPVAGIPSQTLALAGTPSVFVDHLSTVFITPGFRVKLLPGSPVSPWASIGGGWARYSTDTGVKTNKGALEYGGGVDFKTKLPALGFRAEVRDFVTGDPNFPVVSIFTVSGQGGLHHHNILAGGGIVLRF